MNFLIELLQRLRTERPDFFKKLQWIFVAIGGLSAALAWVVGHSMGLPDWVIQFNKYLVSFSGSAIFMSFLPNKSTTDIENKK